MKIYDILLIAFVLSLDAFAVSINCGLKLKQVKINKYLQISFSFAFFQMLMPLLGWLIGFHIKDFVAQYAYIIAFFVFAFLGIKTLSEAFKKKCGDDGSFCNCEDLKCLGGLSIATSIDAFVMGLVLALFQAPLLFIISLIGLITLIMVLTGCFLGKFMGDVLRDKAILLSGLILIALALKVLFEGLVK